MLSENGIEALYDDREETHWDFIKIDIRWEEFRKRVGGDQKRRTRGVFLAKKEEAISKIQEMITEEMMV